MGAIIEKIKSLIGSNTIATPVAKPKTKLKPIPHNACFFCKKTGSDLRNYYNDSNKRIKVCCLCTVYAERRAYRRK